MAANERKILTTLAIDGEKAYRDAMKSAYSEIKVLNSELRANSAEFATNEKNIEELTKRGELLNKEIAQQKEIVRAATQAAEEAAVKYKDNQRVVDQYRIKLNNAQAALSKMENALDENNRKLADAKNRLKAVSEGLEKMSGKLKTAGEAMQKAGTKITTHVTVPILGAAGAAIKLAADYEETVNKINTLDLSASSAKIQGIKSDITALSNATGTAATAISEATYQMGSALGSLGSDVVEHVEIATKAAIGGFTDAATAVDGLTTVYNAYGKSTKEEMQQISDFMLTAQNLGKTTFGEIASSVGNVVKPFKEAGGAADELMASYAILTKNGIATSQATTGVKAALSNILKPTKEATAAAKALGLNFSAANIQANGWSGMLEDINASLKRSAPEYAALTETYVQQQAQLDALMKKKDASKKTDKALNEQIAALKKEMKQTGAEMEIMAKAADSPIAAYATLFGSVEGLNSMLVLSSDQGIKQYNEAMDAMQQSTGATEAAYEKMQEGISAKSRKVIQSVKNFGIEIGDKLIVKAAPALKWAQEMTSKLSELNDETQNTIIKIAGVIAVAGPVILVLGKVTSAVGSVSKGLSLLAANPVALAIAGVAALTVALIALSESMKDETSVAAQLSEKTKQRTSELHDQEDAYYELKNAQAEQAEADLAQIQNTQSLWEELQSLTSETGQVTAANQARVAYILGSLNEAYGTEYALVDGMIVKYQNMQTEMDNLIEKRKYEIVQKAALPLYEKAITDELELRMDAERDLAALEEARAEKERLLAELTEKYGGDRAKAEQVIANNLINATDNQAQQYIKVSQAIIDLGENYESSTAAVKRNLADQTSYQQAELLAQQGNYEEAFAILDWYASETGQKYQEMQGDQQAQRELLESEYQLAVSALETYLQDVENGTATFNETTLRSLSANASNMYQKGKEIGANVGDGLVSGLKGEKVSIGSAISEVTNYLVTSFKNFLGISSPSKVIDKEIMQDGVIAAIITRLYTSGAAIKKAAQVSGMAIKDGLADSIDTYSGLAQNAFRRIVPDTKMATLTLDVNRRFNDAARSAGGGETRYYQSSQISNSRQQTVTQNNTFYANNTSYAEQQRLMRKSQRDLVRELSAVGI